MDALTTQKTSVNYYHWKIWDILKNVIKKKWGKGDCMDENARDMRSKTEIH